MTDESQGSHLAGIAHEPGKRYREIVVRQRSEVIMKLKTLMLLVVVIFTLGVTLASLAQVAPRPLLKAEIPFDFIVGGMHLPAGQYALLHIGGPNTIMLRNAQGHGEALVSMKCSSKKLRCLLSLACHRNSAETARDSASLFHKRWLIWSSAELRFLRGYSPR